MRADRNSATVRPKGGLGRAGGRLVCGEVTGKLRPERSAHPARAANGAADEEMLGVWGEEPGYSPVTPHGFLAVGFPLVSD
jgi:hypothetical protein